MHSKSCCCRTRSPAHEHKRFARVRPLCTYMSTNHSDLEGRMVNVSRPGAPAEEFVLKDEINQLIALHFISIKIVSIIRAVLLSMYQFSETAIFTSALSSLFPFHFYLS